MDKEKMISEEEKEVRADFEEVELTDCDVPINCPLGLDPAEDWFPDHH